MGALTIATLLLFLGATGKSAQIPLYIWLPDAMEGPTPVSALIHAATMVTAGVYMIGRNAVLFQHAPITLAVVAGIGVATALMAGTIGLVQNDIKRVLAYSTVSQLGYMFLAMGVGAYAAGIFHLYTHAFFKALLFLGSGAVIHALHGEQDIRNMGGLRKELPITYWTFLIGAIAIAGVPPLAGFFSKDEILFKTFAGGHHDPVGRSASDHVVPDRDLHVPPGVPDVPRRAPPRRACAPATTRIAQGGPAHHGAWRMTRMATRTAWRHLHDAPPAMALALDRARDRFGRRRLGRRAARARRRTTASRRSSSRRSRRTRWRRRTEFQVVEGRRRRAPPAARPAVRTKPAPADEQTELLLMGAVDRHRRSPGIGLAMYFWLAQPQGRPTASRAAPAPIHTLLLNKYYIDELYDAVIVRPIKAMSTTVLWKGADAALIDGSVNGVGKAVRGTSAVLRRLQSGSVRAYAASLFLGVVVDSGLVSRSGSRADSRDVAASDRQRYAAVNDRFSAAGRRAAGAAGRRARRSSRARGRRCARTALAVSLVAFAATLLPVVALQPRRAPTSSSSRAAPGCRSSASPTTSASTASACS